MSPAGIFEITYPTYGLGEVGGLAHALQIEVTCTACGSAEAERDVVHIFHRLARQS